MSTFAMLQVRHCWRHTHLTRAKGVVAHIGLHLEV